MSSRLPRQFRLLARRSLVRTFRDPGTIIPPLIVPLLLFIVVSSGLAAAAEVPGFPTDSFATFALTIAFANGAITTIVVAGVGVAVDIESGFMYRLALTPIRGAPLLVAQLVGPFALGIVQAVVFFGVGYAADARVASGVEGALVLTALFLVAVVGFGALGLFVGLWTASVPAVNAIAPLVTVFLFLSSVNFPRNLIDEDWFRAVATVNPISYLVEGMRSLLIESSWDGQALALGFAFAIGLIVIMLSASAFTLRRRLVRT